jgi:threonyl-tRNA synthetase
MKIPYMLVVGDREKEAGQVAVRTLKGEDKGAQSVENLVLSLQKEISSKSWAGLSDSLRHLPLQM